MIRRAVSIVCAAALLVPAGAASAAGEVVTAALQTAYARVLANPADTAANLEYAQIAESLGQYRKALATYERILVNDPDSQEAKLGLQRMRRMLQPEETKVVIEAGVIYESNPREVPSDADGDVKGIARAFVRDERNVFDRRWRSEASGTVIGYDENDDLDYGHVGFTVGPILDVSPSLAVQPFLGGGAAMFDGRFFYGEAVAGLLFEGRLNGAYQTARVRAGYRDYDPFWTSDEGFFADATAMISFPDVLAEKDVIILTPTVRWSDISGMATINPFPGIEVEPGRYLSYAVEIGYYRQIMDNLNVGASILVRQVDYATDTTPSGDIRSDLRIRPGAHVTFKNFLRVQTDLKLDYYYDINDSNDPNREWEGHSAAARVVTRF